MQVACTLDDEDVAERRLRVAALLSRYIKFKFTYVELPTGSGQMSGHFYVQLATNATENRTKIKIKCHRHKESETPLADRFYVLRRRLRSTVSPIGSAIVEISN